MNEGNFNFSTYSQGEEHLDYSDCVPCPHCKKPIPKDATLCLYCGEEVYSGKPHWVIVTAVVIAVIFIVLTVLF